MHLPAHFPHGSPTAACCVPTHLTKEIHIESGFSPGLGNKKQVHQFVQSKGTLPRGHKHHRGPGPVTSIGEMHLVRDTRLRVMTEQLRAKLLPPSYSKTACRKLPPFKSSLKDGLQSIFLIVQDYKIKGQCKPRAGHHIAASAGSLRFT